MLNKATVKWSLPFHFYCQAAWLFVARPAFCGAFQNHVESSPRHWTPRACRKRNARGLTARPGALSVCSSGTPRGGWPRAATAVCPARSVTSSDESGHLTCVALRQGEPAGPRQWLQCGCRMPKRDQSHTRVGRQL